MALRRIIYFLSVAACIVFFFANRVWFSWFTLMTVLYLPLFSLLMSLVAMLTIRLHTQLPHSLPMGTDQSFLVRYDSMLPPPVWQCRRIVRRPLTGEQWVFPENAPLPTDHCGGLVCRVEKARIYDYLGLFRFRLKTPPESTVLVYPLPIPTSVPQLEKFKTRTWKPKWGGGFSENHELREYAPGDNIRQIHWKLSAKTGSLILRQPMQANQHRLILRMQLCGTAQELDRKLGRLLWLGDHLLQQELPFTLQVTTANGTQNHSISDSDSFRRVMDMLLCAEPAPEGELNAPSPDADWQFYIGGGADED